MKDKVNHISC